MQTKKKKKKKKQHTPKKGGLHPQNKTAIYHSPGMNIFIWYEFFRVHIL